MQARFWGLFDMVFWFDGDADGFFVAGLGTLARRGSSRAWRRMGLGSSRDTGGISRFCTYMCRGESPHGVSIDGQGVK